MRVAIQQIKAWDWMVPLVNPTNEILFNCEKEGNATLYDNLDDLGGRHAE